MRGRRHLIATTALAWVLVLLSACTSGESPSTAPEPSASESVSANAAPSLGQRFPEPSSAPLSAETAAGLQAVLDQWVAQGTAAGVTASVVSAQGSWAGAAGADSRGIALTPDTSMAIASITKPFVAAEVMRLAEDGQVDLDAPMSDYVEHPLTANGATVRDALGMRSGVRPHADSAVGPVIQDHDRHWTPEEALALHTGPLGEPDTEFAYSNFNYILLGLLVERVRGTSLADALNTDLFDVHGLDRFAVQDAELPSSPVAAPGPDTLGPLPPSDYIPTRAIASAFGASGGVAADAPTTARGIYLLYGGQLVSPAAAREMAPPFQDGVRPWNHEVRGRWILGGGARRDHRGVPQSRRVRSRTEHIDRRAGAVPGQSQTGRRLARPRVEVRGEHIALAAASSRLRLTPAAYGTGADHDEATESWR